MLPENAVIAVCHTAVDAETALSELRGNGLDVGCISVLTADEPGGPAAAAYYFQEGRLRSTAGPECCRRMWAALGGCVVLVCPGERTAVLAGPFAESVVKTLEHDELFGDLGPIAGGLYNLGVPRDAARYYELAALQGHPLVIVHGRMRDVARARQVLASLPHMQNGNTPAL